MKRFLLCFFILLLVSSCSAGQIAMNKIHPAHAFCSSGTVTPTLMTCQTYSPNLPDQLTRTELGTVLQKKGLNMEATLFQTLTKSETRTMVEAAERYASFLVLPSDYLTERFRDAEKR